MFYKNYNKETETTLNRDLFYRRRCLVAYPKIRQEFSRLRKSHRTYWIGTGQFVRAHAQQGVPCEQSRQPSGGKYFGIRGVTGKQSAESV